MNPLYLSQYFDYESYCSQYSLLITPNPVVSEATVSIMNESENENFDENAEWEMEVYDNMQNQKLKNEKLNGKSTKIQTNGWKEGVYIVRVKYKNEILQEKLVVTK
jgi:outer membrane protein assembly factor BamA